MTYIHSGVSVYADSERLRVWSSIEAFVFQCRIVTSRDYRHEDPGLLPPPLAPVECAGVSKSPSASKAPESCP